LKGTPQRGGGERRCGCRPVEEEGGGGESKTEGMAKGVKTVVNASTVVANLDKLGDIQLREN